MTALSLLDWRERIDVLAAPASLQARFTAWLDANPRVYGEVVRLAREWRAVHPGRPCGIARIFELLRWDMEMRAHDGVAALNNDYRAPMARLVMQREPDLAGVFETRARRSA